MKQVLHNDFNMLSNGTTGVLIRFSVVKKKDTMPIKSFESVLFKTPGMTCLRKLYVITPIDYFLYKEVYNDNGLFYIDFFFVMHFAKLHIESSFETSKIAFKCRNIVPTIFLIDSREDLEIEKSILHGYDSNKMSPNNFVSSNDLEYWKGRLLD